ncbi:hypothetical protein IFR04_016198, partial [Cadophora malorum]
WPTLTLSLPPKSTTVTSPSSAAPAVYRDGRAFADFVLAFAASWIGRTWDESTEYEDEE